MNKDFKKGLAGMIGGQEESPEKTPRKAKSPKASSGEKPSQEPKSLASQETKRPGDQKTKKDVPKYKAFTKVNYYLAPELVKRIKVLSAKQGRELSDLADEAMRDLLKKHKAE